MKNELQELLEKDQVPRKRVSALEHMKEDILHSLNDNYSAQALWKTLKKHQRITCTYVNFLRQIRIWKNQNQTNTPKDQQMLSKKATTNSVEKVVLQPNTNQTLGHDDQQSKFLTPTSEEKKSFNWNNRTFSDEVLYGRTKKTE